MNINDVNWVGMDGKKPARKFVPINESKNNDDIKLHVLESTLLDMMFSNKAVFSEESKKDITPQSANNNNVKGGNEFFKLSTWKEFKSQARLIAQLLEKDSEKIDTVIDNMQQAFQGLGNGDADKGWEKIQQLQELLTGANSPLGKLQGGRPNVNGLIQQLVPTEFRQNRQMQEKRYDVNLFLDIVLTPRNNLPKLKGFLDAIGPGKQQTLHQILQSAYSNKIPKNGDIIPKLLDIFQQMVNWGTQFKKNGGAIGKAEIALVLFFGDCKLAEEKGDIQLVGSKTTYEIKGEGGAISKRLNKEMFPLKYFPGSSIDIMALPDPPDKKYEDINILKTLGLKPNSIPSETQLLEACKKIRMASGLAEANESKWFELDEAGARRKPIPVEDDPEKDSGSDDSITDGDVEDSNMEEKPTKRMSNRERIKQQLEFCNWGTKVQFKLLFGAMTAGYAAEEGFSALIGINTKNSDKLTADAATTDLMRTNIIKIVPNQKNWYKSGLDILQQIEGVAKIGLKDMMNENNVFKLLFFASSKK